MTTPNMSAEAEKTNTSREPVKSGAISMTTKERMQELVDEAGRQTDVEGICDTIHICFDSNQTARCGPCAIRQAERAGVQTDTTIPNSPQVSRLTRELAALQQKEG